MRVAEGIRRAGEISLATIGLIVLLPVWGAVALAVRVNLGRGVIYRQARLGQGGREFTLNKFRTMRAAEEGREGPEHDAERLTRLGSWLRRTSVDELPSLWNLLRGDIALVGPRPLPVHYWSRFRNDEYERFLVRPGVTGLAQLQGRNTLPWDERFACDVRYVRTRSLWGDVVLIWRTVPMVLAGTGVEQSAGVTMSALPPDRPADVGIVDD